MSEEIPPEIKKMAEVIKQAIIDHYDDEQELPGHEVFPALICVMIDILDEFDPEMRQIYYERTVNMLQLNLRSMSQ